MTEYILTLFPWLVSGLMFGFMMLVTSGLKSINSRLDDQELMMAGMRQRIVDLERADEKRKDHRSYVEARKRGQRSEGSRYGSHGSLDGMGETLGPS